VAHPAETGRLGRKVYREMPDPPAQQALLAELEVQALKALKAMLEILQVSDMSLTTEQQRPGSAQVSLD